ncbi:hypothetical protein [Ekhidna sp. To15]|uniref:hypothetical protein n=1 Tax=Ekhidna sp. To15 TaxID=3395267 RepID=UPI003F51DB26
MRKLALIIGLLVAGNVLFAQDQKPGKERPPVKIEEYKERLKLTESQLAELKNMRESLRPELEAIRKDDSKSRSERMEARAEVMKRQESQVAEILDDEQEAELKEIHREIRDDVRGKRKRKRERRRDG